MQHLQPNTTLQGGKYRIERVLGQGGFGITYLAIQVSLNRKVAIKELFIGGSGQAINDRKGNMVIVTNSANQASFNQQKEKFKKEALRLANLNHPNLVKVHEFFEENGTAYFVMDYIDGMSLRTKMNREGKFSESLVLNYLQQILPALETAHKHCIWHLDIKPENILVDKQGHVYLIDFGASKHVEPNSTLTTSLALAYTPGYCPPELLDLSNETPEYYVQAIKDIGPWTDIYALGATMYNLLTDSIPPSKRRLDKEGRNAFSFPSSISSKTQNLVIWMMKPNREDRPQYVNAIFTFHNSRLEQNEDTSSHIIKAANQGDPDAQYQLAQCYEVGDGINKDETKASFWYQEAAKQGHVEALRSYLRLKYRSDIYDDVYNKVLSDNLSLMVSADEGDRESQYSLGLMFFPGRSIREEKAAALWLEKAAKQGHKEAQYCSAVCYEEGRGVKKDIRRSVELYKHAALNGHYVAQRRLADYYLYGKKVKKDVNEALKWYSMIGEELTDKDLLSIGICFEAGDGISMDKEKAVEYYRKSAEKGNTIAQYRLGLCYENGIGVAKDIYWAKTWYEKAADNDINARNRLTAVKEYEKKQRTKENLNGFLVIGSTVLTFFLGCIWYWNTPEDSWTHNTFFNIGGDYLIIGPWIVVAITFAVYKIMASITTFDD